MGPLPEPEMARLRSIIERRAGLRLDDRFADAVGVVLRGTGIESAGALAAALDGPGGRAAWERLIPLLTVGETHFWRDAAQFRLLEDVVVPDLLRRNAARRRLRVWSAGCASGEEAYSLAILLRRRPEFVGWRIEVLGTDIDPEALARARVGVYGPWSFRELPPAVLERCFERVRDGRLRVVDAVRRIVHFGELNLVAPGRPITGCDLVLCRNVLMHLNDEAVPAVVATLHGALRPGGWLAVGHAEPPPDRFGRFEAHRLPGSVLYRRPVAPAATSAGAGGAAEPAAA